VHLNIPAPKIGALQMVSEKQNFLENGSKCGIMIYYTGTCLDRPRKAMKNLTVLVSVLIKVVMEWANSDLHYIDVKQPVSHHCCNLLLSMQISCVDHYLRIIKCLLSQ
jgi:hypothetical protein